MGAEVIPADRASDVPDDPSAAAHNFWQRGLRSTAVDLEPSLGKETVLRLSDGADVFLESFRPGVANWAPSSRRRSHQTFE